MANSPLLSDLGVAIRSSRPQFLIACLFSLAINILYLTSPLYMLQVYGRAVTSGSLMTLLMLTVVLVAAFLVLGILDAVRARVLQRVGVRLENALAPAMLRASLEQEQLQARLAVVRDFDLVKRVISSNAVVPFLDFPWTPIFLLAAFLLHPMIGFFTLGCAVLLVALALLNEAVLRRPLARLAAASGKAGAMGEAGARHASITQTLGMLPQVAALWGDARVDQAEAQRTVADIESVMSALIKTLRLAMQSLALGLGAWLVITHQSSGGVMYAGSLLMARALQPIELISAHWRTLLAAKAAYGRLASLGGHRARRPTSLPAPTGRVVVENGHFTLSRPQRLILRSLNFELEPGTSVGIVGPSGAGKSLLGRLLVGSVPPSLGSVRLDGVALAGWPREQLGRHIGYLPQQVELLPGSIAQNIARFTPDADAEVIEAAQRAGVHEAILQLPDGYDTEIVATGDELAGGLRQLIGLARAIFRLPALIVLDEPLANLDAEGERALIDCLFALRGRDRTVVTISPRGGAMAAMEKLAVLRNGTIELFGSTDTVLSQLGAPRVVRPREALVSNG